MCISLSHSVRVCAHVDVCQSPYAFCICVRVKYLKVERKHNNRWHAHLFLRVPQKTPTKHVYWEGGIGEKYVEKLYFRYPKNSSLPCWMLNANQVPEIKIHDTWQKILVLLQTWDSYTTDSLA